MCISSLSEVIYDCVRHLDELTRRPCRSTGKETRDRKPRPTRLCQFKPKSLVTTRTNVDGRPSKLSERVAVVSEDNNTNSNIRERESGVSEDSDPNHNISKTLALMPNYDAHIGAGWHLERQQESSVFS